MTVDQHELQSPDGVSVVGRSRMQLTGRQKIGILGAIGVAALAFIFLSHMLGRGAKVEKVETPAVTKGMPFSAPQEAPAPVSKPLPLPIIAPSMPSLPAVTPKPTDTAKAGNDAGLNSDIFSYSGGGGDTTKASRGGADAERVAGESDELSAALRRSDIGGAAKATMLPHPNMTIPEGIVMPCILQTAINSQLKGFVNCVLPAEVRGATGHVILLDKGTTIFGQIRVGLTNGQDRLFILWSRARTPKHVIVALDSPAADELGRSGVPGEVNNHWWRKFSAAVLYTIIGAAPTVAANAVQGGNNNNYNYSQYTSPSTQLADTVLRAEMAIPPTLEKNQGDTVSIFVARDLDFSGVYDIRAR